MVGAAGEFSSSTGSIDAVDKRRLKVMQIITIYQGASGSGADLANAVAQSLGYGPVDREVLVEASLQYGIPEAKLNAIVEQEPRWWATFTRRLEPYKIALQAAFHALRKSRIGLPFE